MFMNVNYLALMLVVFVSIFKILLTKLCTVVGVTQNRNVFVCRW